MQCANSHDLVDRKLSAMFFSFYTALLKLTYEVKGAPSPSCMLDYTDLPAHSETRARSSACYYDAKHSIWRVTILKRASG